MLETILIAVAAVVILLVAVAATRAPAYHVERRLEVTAPSDGVFAVLDDLRRFASVYVLFGAPLERDPTVKKTFEGPATGVGQSFAWSGKDVGTGAMTIEDSVAGQSVRINLVFVKPMASTSTLALTVTGTPAGSLVTWSTTGNHNFIGRAFGIFVNLDNMLGADIEKGLALLKTVAEGTVATAAS